MVSRYFALGVRAMPDDELPSLGVTRLEGSLQIRRTEVSLLPGRSEISAAMDGIMNSREHRASLLRLLIIREIGRSTA